MVDGILLLEGLGMLLLKWLVDVEWDGDWIYVVVKGVGILSDGKVLGLLVFWLEGEILVF